MQKKAKAKPKSGAKPKRLPAAAKLPDLDPRLAALAALYEKEPRVTVGKLFASMGLKVDGKIFAMVVRGNLVVKLPRERVEQLVQSKAGSYFDPGHGRLMKEWITMTAKKPDATTLGREAFAFVGKK
jgi:TfoX/Sxy family transcriptional regulator of competence genes